MACNNYHVLFYVTVLHIHVKHIDLKKNNTLPILFQQQETKFCKSTLFDLNMDDIYRSESGTFLCNSHKT